MKVINKHPNYINSSDRIRKINHAYTIVFQAINRVDKKESTNANKVSSNPPIKS
ncbi:MAG TPA: hypothetical protein GXZ21_10900 [Clostridiales bacterium]|nr:hypothetical protein [Clostridiales bacterium]